MARIIVEKTPYALDIARELLRLNWWQEEPEYDPERSDYEYESLLREWYEWLVPYNDPEDQYQEEMSELDYLDWWMEDANG